MKDFAKGMIFVSLLAVVSKLTYKIGEEAGADKERKKYCLMAEERVKKLYTLFSKNEAGSEET